MSSAQEIWQAALGELQLQVSKSNYRTWFKGARGVACEGDTFVVGVPDAFVAEYLEKNQRSLIEKTLIGLTNRSISVRFRVDTTQPGPADIASRQPRAASAPDPGALNSKYTFESFIVGSCNRLAHAAAIDAAQSPGQNYNPLFIYGGSGLGKTHLLQAIGRMALARNERVLYVSGEQFTNDFISAIRERNTDGFRNKYRRVDLLLLDDIHFLSGKERTEESFFHTFNELHNANRQMVITSDRPPKSIPLLEDRMRSRFEWGLAVGIQPPDFETRLAILRDKVKQTKIDIPVAILEIIARHIESNIRALEGGLNRVISFVRLTRAPLTPELAAKALKDISGGGVRSVNATSELVINTVATSFQLAPEALTGRSRTKEVAQARQIAMYLLKQQNHCSLSEIGAALGGRNPSTVSHACEKIAVDIKDSPLLKRQVDSIKKGLSPKRRRQVSKNRL